MSAVAAGSWGGGRLSLTPYVAGPGGVPRRRRALVFALGPSLLNGSVRGSAAPPRHLSG